MGGTPVGVIGSGSIEDTRRIDLLITISHIVVLIFRTDEIVAQTQGQLGVGAQLCTNLQRVDALQAGPNFLVHFSIAAAVVAIVARRGDVTHVS